MNANLLIRVQELANLRRDAAQARYVLEEAEAQFEAAHAAEIDAKRETAKAVADAETALLAVVAELYAENGEKNPAPGVKVQLRAAMDYDEGRALAWARETKMALLPESLDRKAFEKIAKATPLDFVTYREDPTVTIATDLSKVFEDLAT